MTKLLLHIAAGLLALLCVVSSVRAQVYPARPITLVVPLPAGGGADATARIIGEKLSRALKQQVIVDNRASGGALLGTRAVARAAPDGYTLLLGHTAALAINPNIYAKPGYDPRTDFAPIGLIAAMPVALVVHPSVKVANISDLVALARSEPGRLAIGTPVVGSPAYIAAGLFNEAAGLDLTVVPYKGSGPLANDLLGGHVAVGFNTLAPIIANVTAGNLRALAVASATRSNLLPQVPTLAESGLAGVEAATRYGLLAPAKTAKAIVTLLNRELRAAVDSAEVTAQIAADGGDPLTSTPEEYAADIDREVRKWGALVRKLGLKAE